MNIRNLLVAAAFAAVPILMTSGGILLGISGAPLLWCFFTSLVSGAAVGSVLKRPISGGPWFSRRVTVPVVLSIFFPVGAILWGLQEKAAPHEISGGPHLLKDKGEKPNGAAKEPAKGIFVKEKPGPEPGKKKEALPAVPIMVTEEIPGQRWRVKLSGATSTASVIPHLESEDSPVTIRMEADVVYRLSTTGKNAVRWSSYPLLGDARRVKGDAIPPGDLRNRKFFIAPSTDSVVCLWLERGGPCDVLVERSRESLTAALAGAQYLQYGKMMK